MVGLAGQRGGQITSVAAGLSNPAAAALGIRRCDRPPVQSAGRNG